ncbi:Nucleotide-binding universal stress protein, UspA family [Thermodesulfobium acidiphilum]|uniref:Nucleotide-binding universal stress protein, UspA family n=2 Tax=Thermodesulfobium acidiphilum TaxID=1794699 RepID=A0A2R4VYK2_THEAF|nr:Nucleotide-binding universal stress protein, UspA family [Thermodesulfobium acidiphilum]
MEAFTLIHIPTHMNTFTNRAMYKKILAAIDGSVHTQKVLDTTIALAKAFDSSVEICHAICMPPMLPDLMGAEVAFMPQMIEDLEKNGKKIIEDARKYLENNGIKDISIFMDIANAANMILERIKSENFDLVVLGSRGLNEFEGFLMGSVSDKISHHAKCSVFIVR